MILLASTLKVTFEKDTELNRLFFIPALIGACIWLTLQFTCIIHRMVLKKPKEEKISKAKSSIAAVLRTSNVAEMEIPQIENKKADEVKLYYKWKLTEKYCQYSSWMCIIGLVISCILSTKSSEKNASHILFLSTSLLLIGLVSIYSFLVYKAVKGIYRTRKEDLLLKSTGAFFRYFGGFIGFLSVICSAMVIAIFALIFAKKK